MVKRICVLFTAAVMTLSVLLCGCEAEERGEVILIGSAGADVGSSASGTNGNTQAGLTVPGTPGIGQAGTAVPGSPGSMQAGTAVPGNAGSMPEGIAASGSPEGGQAGNLPPEPAMIRVYVCGAVVSPGVVEIPQGSRIEDALAAAGGFLPGALAAAVNLADWAVDGQMLYFPTEEEGASWKPMPGSADSREEQSRLVDINTAPAALLCTLPGIGEAKAAEIIAYREAHGSFASCEDIMKVPGIKTNIYEKICDKITVN